MASTGGHMDRSTALLFGVFIAIGPAAGASFHLIDFSGVEDPRDEPRLPRVAPVRFRNGRDSAQDTAASDTAVLDKAVAYVRQFESSFAVVICDETYTQREQVDEGARSPQPTVRTLRSEVLFLWVADARRWLSVRNVLAVDGRPVADSDASLERALKEPLPARESRLHVLAAQSARFNIGGVYRDFNNPTLTLQFLDPTYRSRFIMMVHRRTGSAVSTIQFEEIGRPTVIQDQRGTDRAAKGTLSVRDDDGAVVQTTLNLAGDKTTPDASLAVDYRHDSKLLMWVPSQMRERYRTVSIAENMGRRLGSLTRFSTIMGTATYANYRRFETSGRLISPSTR
jgi:hypothetical protein